MPPSARKNTEDNTSKMLQNGETLADYDFALPRALIAQTPVEKRDESRLLVVHRKSQSHSHKHFHQLPQLLNRGDLLVVNDTKVIPARLIGKKPTGGKAEVFLSKPLANPNCWEALVKTSGKVKPSLEISLDGGSVRVLSLRGEGLYEIELLPDNPFEDAYHFVEASGGIPLPPYIERRDIHDRREEDKKRYQTVYAKHKGASAAPTAGLHFTRELMEALETKGVNITDVTLHVGLGTFMPIRENEIRKVKLHSESYFLPEKTVTMIDETKKNGGRVVAVGTTSVRVLESAKRFGKWHEHAGETDIFIHPGVEFQAIDALITNFHLPKSSLIMLVSAFMGRTFTLETYREAVDMRYRFFSYGDAMLIL